VIVVVVAVVAKPNRTVHYVTRFLLFFTCSTHVAGTACGANYGVSKNCKLCAVKVLNSSGSGTTSDVISGVNHVVKKCRELGGLCVANMSLGSSAVVNTINAAVANAVSAGVVMVVAAGNSNKDACSFSPASTTSAITVGSTSNTNTDARSSFSNYGNCVDVYAPGSGIKSAWKGGTAATNTISGTSMASPRKFSMFLLMIFCCLCTRPDHPPPPDHPLYYLL